MLLACFHGEVWILRSHAEKPAPHCALPNELLCSEGLVFKLMVPQKLIWVFKAIYVLQWKSHSYRHRLSYRSSYIWRFTVYASIAFCPRIHWLLPCVACHCFSPSSSSCFWSAAPKACHNAHRLGGPGVEWVWFGYIVHFPTKPIWASNFITFQPFNFVLFEILMGSPKALSYVEFFAGEANVFSQVKKMYGATAIDIEYYKSPVGPHSNPFDILTASGLASLNLIRNIYSLFFGWWKYFWKSTQVSMDQNHICVCGLKRKVYFQFHMTWGWQYIWCCLAVNRPSVDYSGQSAVPGLRSTVAPRGKAFCCQRAWKRWIM